MDALGNFTPEFHKEKGEHFKSICIVDLHYSFIYTRCLDHEKIWISAEEATYHRTSHVALRAFIISHEMG